MRIAFFHELHAGGARRSVNEFGKYLKKRHQIDLYFVDERPNHGEKKFFHSVHFYPFITKKWNGGDWKAKLYKDSIELYKVYTLHKKIAKVIDSGNYDLVFIDPSKMTQAPFILRFLKTKKVYYCQEPLRMVYEDILAIPKNISSLKYHYEKINRFVRKKIDKYNISKADVIIANSKYTSTNIKKAYGLKSIVSYMGVDTKIFKPVNSRKDIDVLFVGSYDVASGHTLLEKAINYLKNDVVIKVLASEKQWITIDKQIRDLYCRAKIAVALAHNEPFGLIPLETMACGVPMIAVNEGGYKETVIDGKTGYLIVRDPKMLAQKITYILTHSNKLLKMSHEARNLMENNWTWDCQTKKLEKIMISFINSSNKLS